MNANREVKQDYLVNTIFLLMLHDDALKAYNILKVVQMSMDFHNESCLI